MTEPSEHVDHLLDDYIHSLLGHRQAEEVRRHCETCPSCKAALEAACRRLDALRQAAPEPAPATLIEAALQRVAGHEKARRGRRRRLGLGLAAPLAASLLLLIGMQAYYETLAPTPYDLLVLGQRSLLAAADASLRVRLVDRRSGAALAGVPVTVELLGRGKEIVELARFRT